MTHPAKTQHATTHHATPPAGDHAALPLWVRPGVLAVVAAVVIVYGSLIPFDFAWATAVQRHGGAVHALWATAAAPQWVQASAGRSALGVSFALSDLAINALLYLPLGITLRMALRRRGWQVSTQVIASALLALTLSWSVESLQSLMPARVSSLNDVAVNFAAALTGALVAPLLWGLYRRVVFTCYCRLARLSSRLYRWADRPIVAMTLAILNALIIGLWYVGELHRAGIGNQTLLSLPFERVFDLPYDMGFLLLGRALLAYAGIGCLLLLLTYTGARRLAMNWVVLAVVLLAFAAELSRAATHDAVPDVTGPLLALAAVALMTVTVYTFSIAVQRANRRRAERSFEGPDRRRQPHEYV